MSCARDSPPSRATPWPAPGLAAPLRSVFAVRPSAPALGDVLSKHHAKPTFECVSYNEKTRFGYALRNDPTVILIVCDYLVVEFLLHHFDVARGSKGPYCYVSPLLSPASFRLSRLGPRRDLHNALEAPLPDAAAVASASLAKRPSQKLSRQKSLKRYPCIVWT